MADVVTLLAFLMESAPVHLLRHGALPIRAVRELNCRLWPPVDLAGVRSERQAGRIPFLHRLAQQAGLIAPINSALQLTPAAWDWLGWPLADRWRTLWEAWLHDAGWNELGVRDPAILPALRRDLLALLALHSPAEPWPGPVFGQRATALLATHLPPASAADDGTAPDGPATAAESSLRAFLTGPLAWLGAVRPLPHPTPLASLAPPLSQIWERGEGRGRGEGLTPTGAWLLGHSASPPPTPPPAPIQVRADLAVWAPRATAAQTRVRLAAQAEWVARLTEADIYRVSRASVYRHLQAGGTLDDIIAFLETSSSSRPLPAPAQDLLASWGHEHGRLRLRTVTVLEADSRETLQDLWATRGARRYLTATLSPRIAAVMPERATGLPRWLLARGYLPAVDWPTSISCAPAEFTPAEAAYLWLAVQVYQALARHWGLPARIPQSTVERLAGLRPAHLTPGTARPWIAAAEACDAALRHLNSPDEPTPLVVADEEKETMPSHEESPQRAELVAQLEAAIAAGAAVAITYYTAGRDAITERRVEPLRIEWWGPVPYLVAWCTWRRAERVFRVDRIRQLAVLTKP